MRRGIVGVGEAGRDFAEGDNLIATAEPIMFGADDSAYRRINYALKATVRMKDPRKARATQLPFFPDTFPGAEPVDYSRLIALGPGQELLEVTFDAVAVLAFKAAELVAAGLPDDGRGVVCAFPLELVLIFPRAEDGVFAFIFIEQPGRVPERLNQTD